MYTSRKKANQKAGALRERLEAQERASEEMRQQIWGPEPPYTPSREDRATWLEQLYYGWVGDFIYRAAKGDMTEKDLPPPLHDTRPYNAGKRLSEQVHNDLAAGRRWNSYIGCEVHYVNEPETHGFLRYLGYLRQSDRPRSIIAGVEWTVLPRHRRNAEPSSAEAPHNGEVHGERLFYPKEKASMMKCSCEPVARIALLTKPGEVPPPAPPLTPNVMKSLVKALLPHMLWQIPFKFLSDGCGLLLPVLLEYFVAYLEEKEPMWSRGIFLAVFIFLMSIVQSCAAHKYDHISIRASSVFEISTFSLLFEKCLTIGQRALSMPEMSMGRIINMAASDVENIANLNWYVIYFISAPIQLIVCVILLYRLVGWCAFCGFLVLFVSFPLQTILYKWQQNIREGMASIVDNRLKRTNELLSGIRIVKFMGLEPRFLYLIERARAQELKCLKKLQVSYVLSVVVDEATPVLLIAVVFILYHVSGNELTSRVVFPTIALLNIMKQPFFMIPVIIGALLSCLVSARRITVFMECEDVSDTTEDIHSLFTKGVSGAFVDATVHAVVPRALPLYVSRIKSSIGHLVHSFFQRGIPEAEWVERPQEEEKDDEKKKKTAEGGEEEDQNVSSQMHQLTAKDLLKNMNVIIPEGKLTVVTGPTGCGKSTFLSALMGGYGITEGQILAQKDKMAYVPQMPWIMNATLRENIIFFSEEEPQKLAEVLRCCQLERDVELLVAGLDTEIGEKGVNLSGGQKARVNLARAVYADREMYLLDDPLSALDAHVGESVMEDCILGKLRNKTRVLATHQLHVVPKADYVIALEGGGVRFAGTPEAYAAFFGGVPTEPSPVEKRDEEEDANNDMLDDGHPQKAFITCSMEKTLAGEDDYDRLTERRASTIAGSERLDGNEENAENKNTEGQLMSTEERAIGSIPWSTYAFYVNACGGKKGWLILCAVYTSTQVLSMADTLWLTFWATDAFHLTPSTNLYVYLILVTIQVVVSPCREYYAYHLFRKGSRELHTRLLRSVGIASVNFFDTTPLGRIVNRFSNDIAHIDDALPESFLYFFFHFFNMVFTFILMSVSQPLIIFVLLPCFFLYRRVMMLYNAANLEIRRIKSISHSPVFTLLEEFVGGKTTIAIFGKAHVLMAEVLHRLDVLYRSLYMENITNRWLGTRVELVSSSIIGAIVLLGVFGKQFSLLKQNPGLVSLSLTIALTLTETLNWLVRDAAGVEGNMNSVERILHYMNDIEHEDMPELNDLVDKQLNNDSAGGGTAEAVTIVPPSESKAPTAVQAGSLEFRGVQMRYREGLPLVLSDVSFRIEPREKVGIVGRTGSGKSTLLLTFMRMVDVCGGTIEVNGRAIRSYPLRELRRQFSMIPQDPVLFDGTVRLNVDPFLQASAAEVWSALEIVGLKERVSSEPEGIDGRVLEGGSNFSVGQRQLLCMARALLKKGSGFILMDEATANIDQSLDRQIQGTVMRAFADYTVITIAHRLLTVAQYDKIIVMDHGVVAEMGSPRDLVTREDSVFRGMVDSTGEGAKAQFMTLMNAL